MLPRNSMADEGAAVSEEGPPPGGTGVLPLPPPGSGLPPLEPPQKPFLKPFSRVQVYCLRRVTKINHNGSVGSVRLVILTRDMLFVCTPGGDVRRVHILWTIDKLFWRKLKDDSSGASVEFMLTFTDPKETSFVWQPVPTASGESPWHFIHVLHRLRLPLTTPPGQPLRVQQCSGLGDFRRHGRFDKSQAEKPRERLRSWDADPGLHTERRKRMAQEIPAPPSPVQPDVVVQLGDADVAGINVTKSGTLDSVSPGSPAARAGTDRYVGQRITHMDGTAVSGAEEVAKKLAAKIAAGQQAAVGLTFAPPAERPPSSSHPPPSPRSPPCEPPVPYSPDKSMMSVKSVNSGLDAALAESVHRPTGSIQLEITKPVGAPTGLQLADDGTLVGVTPGSAAEQCGARRVQGMRLVAADGEPYDTATIGRRLRERSTTRLVFAPGEGEADASLGAVASPSGFGLTGGACEEEQRHACPHLSPPAEPATVFRRPPLHPAPSAAPPPLPPPRAVVVPVPHSNELGLTLQHRAAPGLPGLWPYVVSTAPESPFARAGADADGHFLYGVGGTVCRTQEQLVRAFEAVRRAGHPEVLCELAIAPPAWVAAEAEHPPSTPRLFALTHPDSGGNSGDALEPPAAPADPELSLLHSRLRPNVLGLTQLSTWTAGTRGRCADSTPDHGAASCRSADPEDSLFDGISADSDWAPPLPLPRDRFPPVPRMEPLSPESAGVRPSFRTHRLVTTPRPAAAPGGARPPAIAAEPPAAAPEGLQQDPQLQRPHPQQEQKQRGRRRGNSSRSRKCTHPTDSSAGGAGSAPPQSPPAVAWPPPHPVPASPPVWRGAEVAVPSDQASPPPRRILPGPAPLPAPVHTPRSSTSVGRLLAQAAVAALRPPLPPDTPAVLLTPPPAAATLCSAAYPVQRPPPATDEGLSSSRRTLDGGCCSGAASPAALPPPRAREAPHGTCLEVDLVTGKLIVTPGWPQSAGHSR